MKGKLNPKVCSPAGERIESPVEDQKSSPGFIFPAIVKIFRFSKKVIQEFLRNSFHLCAVIFTAAIILFMVHSAILNFTAHIINLYTKLEVSIGLVHEMQAYTREFYNHFDELSAEEIKARQKRILFFEVRFLNAVEPFIYALHQAEQVRD